MKPSIPKTSGILKLLPKTSKPASSSATIRYVGKKHEALIKLHMMDYNETGFTEKELKTVTEGLVFKDSPTVTRFNFTGVHDEKIMRSTGYQERTYRNFVGSDNLVSFNVIVRETDLLVHAAKPLENVTLEMALKHRGVIEKYISAYPKFLKTLVPWTIEGFAPKIIREMVYAGKKAGVGPMAAVAGAVAENVGNDLLSYSDEVVIENGGDIYLKTNNALTVGVYAADSPLSLKIGLRIDSRDKPVGVCTSSGTVGHSLSFGKADAVCIVSDSCSLADAVATSVGNRVKRKKDIKEAIEFGNAIEGVRGIVVIIGDEAGFWGNLEVVSL